MKGYVESSMLQQAMINPTSIESIPDNEIEEIISMLDINKNGKINLTDFVTATLDSDKFLTSEKIEAIFNILNIDSTGIITPLNIKDGFSKFGR